jgi:uncharacterized protein involved in tolerance to divalent cations
MSNTSIESRQNKDKTLIINELKTTPIVQIACQKTMVSRASFYRWKQSDKKFAKKVDGAIEDGIKLINDMAEAQLLSAIKNQNITSIIFWLKNHHPSYENKLEVTARIEEIKELSKDQKEIIKRALSLTVYSKNTEVQDEQ